MSDVPAHVAHVLSRFQNVTARGDGWLCSCPAPGHSKGRGDKTPSLRVAVGETGRSLVVCRTGCETKDVLAAVGLSYQDLLPPAGEFEYFRAARAAKYVSPDESAARDKAYRAILDRLELEPDHLAHLFSRGLDKAQVEALGYKSIRAGTFLAACRAVNPAFDPLTYEGPIPGLRSAGKDPLWSGLVVPVRNGVNQVVALKVRRFADGPKYLYLSDPEAPSGAPVHWPCVGENEGRPSVFAPIRVTEGELKADVATLLSGVYTVSVPGVSNWKPLIDGWRRFGEVFPRDLVVHVAFDWTDVCEKEGVRAQTRALVEALGTAASTVVLEHWSHREYKGIDDLLAAGHTPDLTVGRDACLKLLDSLDPEPLGMECVKIVEEPDVEVPADPCEFPVNVFPPRIREFVLSVAEQTDAPVDFPALAALVVAGTAIGASRRIKIIPGWYEAPIYYAAVIAPPGAAKSPSINRVQRPMVAAQAQAFARFQRDLESWKAAEGEKRKLPRPVPQEMFTTDPTVAALTAMLAANPKGVLLSMDEILGWVRSFNQFNAGGNDQQYYLTLWNGQSLKVNRKTGDNPILFVKFPYASILGGIQPIRLADLSGEGRGQDGFLDRFLFSYPAVKELPYWEPDDYEGTGHDAELADAWAQVWNRLYGLRLGRDDEPEVLNLTRAGWEQSCRWYNAKVVDPARDPAFPEYLRGFWLKLRAYYFRFALTLELMWWATTSEHAWDPPTEVSARSLTMAAALASYFQCQARRVAGYASPSEEVQQVDELCRWAWSGKKGGTVTARQVTTSNNPRLPGKIAAARELLLIAAQYGRGEFHPEYQGAKDVLLVPKPEGK